jgi:hypothetical protein
VSGLAAFQSRFLECLFSGDAQDGLALHRRNVRASLEGAVATAYPVVSRLVGAAFFAEAARRYALASPSHCGDLNAYGGGFGDFLAAYPAAAALAWLPDVARLEWAMHECTHAADAPALDRAALEALAALDGTAHERLRFRLHPAVRLLASRHPLLAIWEANQPGRDGTPARPAGGERLLVRREGEAVVAERLHPREWRFLARVRQGATLAAACAAFGATADSRLAPALARHARAGVFAGFDLADAPA